MLRSKSARGVITYFIDYQSSFMLRFILIVFCFLCSLFTVLPVPAKQVWYVAIAVSEFPWVWIAAVIVLLLWTLAARRLKIASLVTVVAALLLLSTPIIRAYSIAADLDARLIEAFGSGTKSLAYPHRQAPFRATQMISGIGAARLPFTTLQYAVHDGVTLTLDYTKAEAGGLRPCLLVVHGGSWKKGNSSELPDVNAYFAKAGYNVASINYRLAPQFKSPAPQEDVQAALAYLKSNASKLNLDPTNFVLMGRSAGGQIVLTAAYGLHDPAIRGVVDFYGPTDMFWAYDHPDAPLVMDSRKVMEDFFGGTPQQKRDVYKAGSPTNLITRSSVPTLIVHGGNDAHVHFDEAEILADKLKENRVPHLLLGLPWATHGCEYSLNGPSGQLSAYAAERFMNAVTAGR